MRITEIHVDRYGPLSRSAVEVEPGVHVLFGPNEAGKTLFLEATLRLLEPEITGTMPKLGRIEEGPHGYVRVSRTDGEIHGDGSESALAGTDVTPAHLANIFVVRESGLSLLSDEHSYYSSLTEHIGELHTTALDRVESELLERGRLTDTRRVLSSAEDSDDAARVRSRAGSLKDDVEAYVEEAEEEGLDGLEGRLVATRARQDEVRREVEALDRSEILRRHERLKDRLETYRDASEALQELEAFTRDTLRNLVRRRDSADTERSHVAEWEKKIEDHGGRVAELERRVDEKEDVLAPLEEREPDVDRLESRLTEFREQRGHGGRVGETERVALWTGAGLLGGGSLLQAASLVLGLGLDTVALAVVLLGALGVLGYGVLRYRRHRLEAERRALARAAASAGLEEDRPQTIAASIRNFRSRVEGLRERIEALEEEADRHRTRIETFRSQIDESRSEADELEAEIDDVLEEAGVESVKEYEERLERREELERDRDRARQSLVDALADPDDDDWREAVDAWKQQLDDLVEGIRGETEPPAEYDPAAHEERRETLAALEERQEELSARLEAHRDRIDRFERRLRDEISAEPFLDSRLELEARTVDGLRRLATDLDELIRRIDRDAEISRLALDVVDELRAAEERKITDLFASDGPATETFRRISDGRYREVRYDPEARSLTVTDEDGREFGPAQLSKGARDQLYLAARVGLAHRLLGEERGFFLLDDPLVAADRQRLTAAFEVLVSLAERGWQILYFTAKDEVREDMVDELSLPLTTFDARLQAGS